MGEKPNIVLLVLDTLRAKNVSCYGYGRETTPFIDSLAEEGAKFSNAYTVSPWTLPSHASLFTGTYPSEHQANAATKRLPGTFPTMAEHLGGEGYSALAVSNNVWLAPERGMDRGFDDFKLAWQVFDTPDVAAPTAGRTSSIEVYWDVAKKVFRGNIPKRVANLFYGYWFQRRRDRAAITNRRILQNVPDEPFFLFANYMEPHVKYNPPREYAERFLPGDVSFDEAQDIPQDPWDYVFGDKELGKRESDILESLYDAAIAYLDDQIRELVADIEERTGRETVFIATSDHGENIGEQGRMGHQYSMEKTVLHIPLVINGPGFKGEVEEQVDLLDVHRTVLEMGGVEPPEHTRGRDLRNLTGSKKCFSQYRESIPPMEILQERYGISEEDLDGRQRMDAVMDGESKLIRFADRTELRSNDGEERVLEDEARKEELLDALGEWESGLEVQGSVEAGEVDENLKRRLEELGYY